MSDARLREAERRWRESASPEDERRYLTEALRAGHEDPARVRLLAHLGSAVPRLVFPDEAGFEARAGLRGTLTRLLAGAGEEACVRGALGAVRALALPAWEAEVPHDDRPRRACEALEEWLDDPAPGRVLPVIRAGRRVTVEPLRRAGRPLWQWYAAESAALAAANVTGCARTRDPDGWRRDDLLRAALDTLREVVASRIADALAVGAPVTRWRARAFGARVALLAQQVTFGTDQFPATAFAAESSLLAAQVEQVFAVLRAAVESPGSVAAPPVVAGPGGEGVGQPARS